MPFKNIKIDTFYLLLCLFFLGLSSSTLFAQKKLSSGTIIYEIVEVKTEIRELELLKGGHMNVYFTRQKQNTELSLMNDLVIFQTIHENSQDSLWSLYDFMGSKYKVRSKVENSSGKSPLKDILYDETSTKFIAGYPCKKVSLMTEEGETDIWVTNKIKSTNSTLNKLFPGLQGYPLEYYVIGTKATLTFRAKKITKELDLKRLEIPESYQELSEKEFKEKMGDMQFGF